MPATKPLREAHQGDNPEHVDIGLVVADMQAHIGPSFGGTLDLTFTAWGTLGGTKPRQQRRHDISICASSMHVLKPAVDALVEQDIKRIRDEVAAAARGSTAVE